MNWKVYILLSKEGNRTYVGCSHDVVSRLQKHNSGSVKATQNGRPWRLIYEEIAESYQAVRKREIYYKSGAGRKKIKEILENK